jgi:putative sensory transduction regulator
MTSWQDDAALDRLEQDIDGWLAGFRAGNPVVAAVDRGEPADAERRWYVRMRGEEKDFITVWLTLGQRTLRYEAYVMPAPEENAAELYEQLLRRNERLVGAHFAIGVEDAIFLRGELPNLALNEAELDRIIGSLYACVEQSFPAMIRLGFASRFRNTGGDTEGDASADRGGDAAG